MENERLAGVRVYVGEGDGRREGDMGEEKEEEEAERKGTEEKGKSLSPAWTFQKKSTERRTENKNSQLQLLIHGCDSLAASSFTQ